MSHTAWVKVHVAGHGRRRVEVDRPAVASKIVTWPRLRQLAADQGQSAHALRLRVGSRAGSGRRPSDLMALLCARTSLVLWHAAPGSLLSNVRPHKGLSGAALSSDRIRMLSVLVPPSQRPAG
jgi:hypothetical protein